MSKFTLEVLATELVREICLYLDSASLRAFTTISRQCCAVSRGLLFRNVQIRVASRRQLHIVTEEWMRKLERWSCNNEVVRLDIDGTMPRDSEDEGQNSVFLFEGDCFRSIADDQPAEEAINDDSAWEPLAELIRQLPCLRNIYYTCTNHFSPCLLSTVHQHLPGCRLHLKSFKLRTLNEPEFEYHERTLATSPNLYSIESSYLINSYEEDSFHQTISRLAPNLREVSVGPSLRLEACPENFLRPRPRPKQIWPGFVTEEPRSIARQAPLKSLRLHEGADLIGWNKLVNLTALRDLQLRFREGNQNAFCWSILHNPFQSLRNLHLEAGLEWGISQIEFLDTISSFVSSLPPLESLTLSANPFQTHQLTSVLERHGNTLRRFHLDTTGHLTSVVFNGMVIDSIRQKCPRLEDLKLLIPRTKGNKAEVEIYRALGAIPRLQELTLILDCSNRTIWRRLPEDADTEAEILSDPSFDEFHQSFVPEDEYDPGETPRNGHVRDALINSALDETLARSIFRCVSAGKNNLGIQLQYLDVSVYGAGFFGEPDEPGCRLPVAGLERVIDQIGKSWKVERSVRDDCPEKLNVREMPSEYRPSGLLFGRMYDDPSILTPHMQPVLRKLWPARKESSDDWREDWHSSPLWET